MEASIICSTGNSSGAGMPPAKEMMSGCAVSFSSSRISEPFSRSILLANCTMNVFLLKFC